MRHSSRILGIDVGGSGVKGALVHTTTGSLVSERFRLPTPAVPTPKALARVVARVVRHFGWTGPAGCGMPGPIKDGMTLMAANLDSGWSGVRAHELYTKAAGCPITVVNDADAAGMAEMRFGAGKGERGVVIVVTLGTGIGSALFVNGTLVPNTEFGQLELRGKPAERRAAARVRKEKNLSWPMYAERLNEYLHALENVVWPDLIIIGGGISRKADRFLPLITTRARVIPALLKNEAGIVGAALGVRTRRGR